MSPFGVGDGSWVIGNGVLPAPDCALVSGPTGDETHVVTEATLGDFAVAFDPFARSVACYFEATNGIQYIAGERSCAEGTETALWQRFSHARNTFDKARRSWFADLESTRADAKAAKECHSVSPDDRHPFATTRAVARNGSRRASSRVAFRDA